MTERPPCGVSKGKRGLLHVSDRRKRDKNQKSSELLVACWRAEFVDPIDIPTRSVAPLLWFVYSTQELVSEGILQSSRIIMVTAACNTHSVEPIDFVSITTSKSLEVRVYVCVAPFRFYGWAPQRRGTSSAETGFVHCFGGVHG